MTSDTNITILQWNMQGFMNNKYALELLVARHKPNIIALQETHIIEKTLHLLHLPGYQVFHHNHINYDYAKSGIALFVKTNLNVTGHKTSLGNLLFQKITIKGHDELHITNIYKENNVNLSASLVNNISINENVHNILLGDLNSQNTLWGSSANSPSGKIFEEFANDKNLVVLNDGSPTLLNTRNTLTAVDVSMSSIDIAPSLTWTCLPIPEAADHFPIKIANNIQIVNRKFSSHFIDRKANWPLFEKRAALVESQFERSININREAAQLKRIIRKAANESIPLSKKPKDKNNPVWFNSDISKLIRLKQKAWILFKRIRSRDHVVEYKRLCAKIKRECKIAKRKTWEHFLNSLNPSMDVRLLWGKVRNLRTNCFQSFPNIYLENNNLTHPLDIADGFARFWSSLSSDSAFNPEVIATKNSFNIGNLLPEEQQIVDMDVKIRLSELRDVLKTLKGSTPARDKITYAMIKNAPDTIKTRLCELYNNILSTGTFPQDWKTAVISPIPKPGKNPNSLEGYRPISLLPVLSKVLEKILARRFWKYTRHHISHLQHAFLPRHGVHSICHQLEEILRRNLKNGKHNLVLSEDIEKAFDRVVSVYVIMELHKWGIPKSILKLLHSFLINRTIAVKVDGYFSMTHPLDNGVPQGSPLSVVLYSVYANSLAKAVENLPGIDYIGIYADNIFAVASGTPEAVRLNLNNLDLKIHEWAKSRGAVIPVHKSDILHVCRKRDCSVSTISIRDFNVQLSDQIRILGIIFTKKLLWNSHVTQLTYKLGKINNLLKLICSRKKGPHIETALNICRSLTSGTILHGITIYGWTSKKNINKINVSINNCFRTACGLLRTTPLDKLRTEANIMDFRTLLEKTAVEIASRAITITSDGLHKSFWKNLDSRRICPPSATENAISVLRNSNILLPQKPITHMFRNAFVQADDSLSHFVKNNTDQTFFKKMFSQKISSFSPNTIYYTDGSFNNKLTSYAIVRQLSTTHFETIKESRLPDHTGIFTAEIAAIKTAIDLATHQDGKTLICTDSLGATQAIIKNHNGVYDDILRLENENHKILILWIPSHIGIPGNEKADYGAKNALNLPLITETPCFPKAISNPFRATRGLQNISSMRPRYHSNLTRSECIMLTRLRVGKCIFNSKHYYEKTDPPRCFNCNVILDIPHLLTSCPVSGMEQSLEEVLNCSTTNNITKIKRSLQKHNIQDV